MEELKQAVDALKVCAAAVHSKRATPESANMGAFLRAGVVTASGQTSVAAGLMVCGRASCAELSPESAAGM